MPLFEKKQQLNQGGKLGKIPPPKDTSGFGGKPFITREGGVPWVRREGFQRTGLPPEEVVKHWNEATKDAPSGYVTPSWAEEKLRKLEGEYSRMTSFTPPDKIKEVKNQIKVLKGFLGKK